MKAIHRACSLVSLNHSKIWPKLGLGIFMMVSTSQAQTSVNGAWNSGSGAWGGNLGTWALNAPIRAADLSLSLKPAATATATRNNRGEIVSINLVSGGLGYTSVPTVIITGGTTGGYGARAVATVNNGVVTGIKLLSKGGGYTGVPTVTISRELSEISVLRSGSGYTGMPNLFLVNGGAYTVPPTVTFTIGTGATATASRSGTTVSAITPTTVGVGYGKFGTSVVISGGNGTGATAEPVITGDVNINATADEASDTLTVTGNAPANGSPVEFSGSDSIPFGLSLTERYFVVTSSGSTFQVSTTVGGSPVNFTSNGNAVAFTSTEGVGRVVGYIITNPGTGYTTNPTVTVVAKQPTIAASATAIIEDGRVTGINLDTGGEGYLDPPQVRFSAGTGEVGIVSHAGTEAVAEIQGGEVTNVTLTQAGGASDVSTTVNLSPQGEVTSIALTQTGQGFTSNPTIQFGGALIRTALAASNVSSGSVSSIAVSNPGAGYVAAPAVSIQQNGWQGYTSAPRVTFISNGIRGAIATATRTGSAITAVSIQDGGANYVTPPTVSFVGGGGSGATATAVLDLGKVKSVTMNSGGSGYTSVPIVLFTAAGVTYPTATASFAAGRVTGFTLNNGGAGHTVAPLVSIAAPPNGGPAATVTAVLNQGRVASITLVTPGGAIPATARAVLSKVGTVDSIQVVQAGTGYTANPRVTIATPTGFSGSVQPAPGGVGSYIYFNNDILGDSTITLDSARTVGMLTIGDLANGQDFYLSSGAGGDNSTLTFDMGRLGAGKSFLNKVQGDQDVISAVVVANEELNVRINAGRLTLNNSLLGTGDLVSSGNGVLTITGAASTSAVDLWLQNRGGTGSGAQVELGTSGGSSFGNVRVGSASLGSNGTAVLQLLEKRNITDTLLPYRGDQIGDLSTVSVDGVSGRLAYFKLMGGDETIGNILDINSSLVLENMEGEGVNTNATLTLGGNNLDSFIGGFARNRASGSAPGTLGITKNGTGLLTLQGGNISYTGLTTLNGGVLTLVNTTNFASGIQAALGTRLNIETTGSNQVNFNDAVTGASSLRKFGTGTLNLNNGEAKLDSVTVTQGGFAVRGGAGSLRGGKSEIVGSLTVRGSPGEPKSLTIATSLSVGQLDMQGRFLNPANFEISGQAFNADTIGNAIEGVLESSGEVNVANSRLRLISFSNSVERTVQTTATNSTSLTLTDATNLVIDAVITLKSDQSATGVTIAADTRILAVNTASRTLTLSKNITIPAGRVINIDYTSTTDGAIRGESLNFADVAYDGHQFIAVTSKGTIHTSLNGQLWDLNYTDPAGVPFSSVAWTGERSVVVGNLGRVLTSPDGKIWTAQDSGSALDINGLTTTNTSFTGNLSSGSASIQNVTGAASFAIGTPVYAFATAFGAQLVSASESTATLVMDSDATNSATSVDFGYFLGTTSTTANKTSITNVKTAQYLTSGMAVSGTSIPGGTTILSVDGPNSTVTLSQPATGTVIQVVQLNTIRGDLVAGSKTVSALTNFKGLAIGMTLFGSGLPAGVTITAMDVGLGTLTLSEGALSSLTASPMGIYFGTISPGSALVQSVSSVRSFRPGMLTRGTMIPIGSRVTATSANSLTLSSSLTVNATAASLTQSRFARIAVGSFTNGSATVTGVVGASSLSVGMPVVLAGVIPPGTFINLISGSNVTLTNQALQGATAVQFSAGFDLVAVGDNGSVKTALRAETGSWLTRISGISTHLYSISASPSALVAVGADGRVVTSSDGITWSLQTPPFSNNANFVLATDTAAKTVTLNNQALTTAAAVSFNAFKANATAGSAVLSGVTAMPSLRVGLPVSAASGIPAGTRITSVNEAGFSFVMSTASTITELQKPLRTFSAVFTQGSTILTEVTDFKGLAVGMLLHGSAFNGTETATIAALDLDGRRIFLSALPPSRLLGRSNFGVLYGDLTFGSSTVTNVTNIPSLRVFRGTAHLTSGKSIQSDGFISPATTISGYDIAANSLTLSSPAVGTATSLLYTFDGLVDNGSNLITGVTDFTGLLVGMNIVVTGNILGYDAGFLFSISGLDSANGTITLSSVFNLNLSDDLRRVPLSIFQGRVTSGSNTVTTLTNYSTIPTVLMPKLDDVFYTGSQFVAVGDYGSILTSSDGSVWTARSSGTGRDLSAVAQAGAQILVAGQDGIILKSSNGVAWSVARAADSAALNDVRSIDQVKAVITSGGKTLALGNGGLSSVDGNTWSTTLNDTFSGTQLQLAIAGNLEVQNSVQLLNAADASKGLVKNQNNTNRIDDAATLVSKGGQFSFINNAALGQNFSETVGKLLLSQGQFSIRSNIAGTGGSSTLRFASLDHQLGATIDFIGRSADNTLNVLGSLGVNSLNRVLFTDAPVLDDGIIGGWATIDGEWATYNSTNGVARIDPTTGYNTGDQTSWIAANNVKMSASDRTLNSVRTINTLNIQNNRTLNLAANRLSIEAGGILVPSGTSNINGTGSLTVGTALNVPTVLNVINNGALNIRTPIQDYQSSVTTSGINAQGLSVLQMSSLVNAGLLPGMEVSGTGIVPGTRILSIDREFDKITLSSPTLVLVPSATALTFRGGSVGLSKSGTGTLALLATNTYTGKTSINAGTLLITSIGNLGAPLNSLVQDQIQLNGGVGGLSNPNSGVATLQIGHLTQLTSPAPDIDLALDDGFRGVSVGVGGGRIEVGQATPNRYGSVPIINFTITNPINALGPLEVAIRSGSNDRNDNPQVNSLTLGDAFSTNLYTAGIQTDNGFEGILRILGNNTIGGIYQQGGDILIQGNNNFTAPINSQKGDITIDGSNTFLGGNTFDQFITIDSGVLKLKTSNALGTKGLKVALGEAGVLRLAGVSQTIRNITDFRLSRIDNNEAPNTLTNATDLIFDIGTNQSMAGQILNGDSSFFGIKLIKRGVGTLSLSNSKSDFKGGVEIQEGVLSVTSIGNVGEFESTLGGTESSNPGLLVIDKSALAFNLTTEQSSDRSFTMGAGSNGATLIANGTIQAARLILGREVRDVFTGQNDISEPIAFKDNGSRSLVLAGTGRGDNTLLLELRDKSFNEVTGLMKLGAGTWVLGKASPYSGITNINEGILTVTTNDALGTVSQGTTVTGDTFTGNYPNGTQITFPLFSDTVLPGGVIENRIYYVVGSTGSSFQIAATSGGVSLPISTPGLNVRLVPKLDSFRSTTLDIVTDRFTGNLINGQLVSFNTQLVAGVTTPQAPLELLTNTFYYVVNSTSGSFQVALEDGGSAVDFTSLGTPGALYYTTADSLHSTSLDIVTDRFTGDLNNGELVTFSSQLVAGLIPQVPAELSMNTFYYVVNSTSGTFQVSLQNGGSVINFTTASTTGSLRYTTSSTGNPSGGVNLTSGTLLLSDVNYRTPETLNFEGGTLAVPADKSSVWAGNIRANTQSNITVGQGGTLTLTGSIIGTGRIIQDGEGRVVMQGETLMPTTNALNSSRHYDVRAGSLVLDYALNNGSKLVDNAILILGGSRRGGEIRLSGGNHEEIVGRTILSSGANSIYRDSGVSTIRLNAIERGTGSSLYLDTGRLAKTDQANTNNILGAWAIIRDAITNAFWVIPGTTTSTFEVTADPALNQLTTRDVNGAPVRHTLANGTLVRFSTTGTMPGGLSANTSYYVTDTSGLNALAAAGTFQVLVSSTSGNPLDITSAGTGTLSMTSQIAFTVNAQSDTITSTGEHRLAKGGVVRVASYGILPGGLSAGVDYYVTDVATRSFRLSRTVDGPPVNITDIGNGVHTVDSQGAEKRVGSSALVFTAEPATFPASDGNGKIKIRIEAQAGAGPITATLTGAGSLLDPYIYTIFTTESINSNNAVISFVNSDTQRANLFKVEISGGNSYVNSVVDQGSYGAPTFLANGTYDNGGNELDWARNEGSGGGSFNDGYIMPSSSYVGTWQATSNTAVTRDISVPQPAPGFVRDTYSLRFATQNPSTVSLNNTSVINSIISGGILVSPTVGANDSAVNGTGLLSTKGEGNLQNLMIHQYNELGSLNIGAKLTNRAAFQREGRLTSSNLALVTLSDITGVSVGQFISGTGISANTRVTAIDVSSSIITLSQAHNGARSTVPVNYTFSYLISGVASTTSDFELTLASVDNLAVGFQVSGTGIANGTLITAINTNTKIVTIDTAHDGFVRSAAVNYTFVSAVRAGVASDPNRRFLAGVTPIKDLAPGMTVTGPGLLAGTLVVAVDKLKLTVTISQDHDGGYRRGDYIFGGSISCKASTGDNYRRRIVGVVKPGNGIPSDPGEFGLVGSSDLYVGAPIAGPGIPVGSTISFIFSDCDIEVSSNHFFTGESTTLNFTPITGIEKLGPGALVLNGDNQYTGVTYIGEGSIRAQKLTDGGVSGSLGLSSAASGNLVFNGGVLQYIGENARTNRGFQLFESAILNIGHEKTSATFSGVVVGTDRLEKTGSGTLVFNGNADLESVRVEEGKLLLQTIDTNPSPGTFAATNFAASNNTSLRVAGGVLELRGTPEGDVNQRFGKVFVVEEGGSEVKVTSVASADPTNLVAVPRFRATTLTLMGQEEAEDIIRYAGGTVQFTYNTEENAGPASIVLNTQTRGELLPWATYRDLADQSSGGVNSFAKIDITTGVMLSADDQTKTYLDGNDWAANRNQVDARDHVSEVGQEAFTGVISSNRYINTLSYGSSVDSTLTINAGATLELLSGAILAGFDVNASRKQILGAGSLTGGARNQVDSDFIVHNYNPGAAFTIGASIVDRPLTADGASPADIGASPDAKSLKTGAKILKLKKQTLPRFFLDVRPGMLVTGPGVAVGTLVTGADYGSRQVSLSLPAESDQVGQSFTFTETINLVQTGIGTTILSGQNTYTGKTFIHGGVLRLDSQNALPGGTQRTGGQSTLILEGGVVGLGYDDFNRILGTDKDKVEFKGSGGFAAYGADRTVNLGGASTPESLRFGNLGFVPDGSSLIFGSQDASHKINFMNPIDLGSFSQVIRVEDGSADIEAELRGELSGLGRLIKFGLGTLRLGVSNTNSGGVEIADGRLIAANLPNVFGISSGPVRIGTSRTNTTVGAGIDLQIEGGTVSKKLEIGAVNAASGAWLAGGLVDSTQSVDVGSQSSTVLVDGMPAIAYYDATNKDLKYVRALDARGTAWNAPVTLASRGDVGQNPSLQIINGNPAVSYYDETNKTLMYVRSTDVPGVAWGAPAPILAPNVLAVASQSDGKILVAGSFTRFDGEENQRRLLRLKKRDQLPVGNQSVNDWIIDTSFEAFVMNGEVRDILVQSDGKIIIGGTFTTMRQNLAAQNDVTRNRLARLNSDGSLDTSFNPNLDGDIRVIVQQPDNKLLIGGSFTAVGGVVRTRVARLNSNGSLDTSFRSPDIRNGEVRAIAVETVPSPAPANTFTYVVGGTFTNIRSDSATHGRLARLDAAGFAANSGTFNPDANGDVNAIVVLPDGKLLVGGAFGAFSAGVQSRTRLARLNVNGSLDNSFAQEVNGTVNRLITEPGGTVLVAGSFSVLGDFNRSFIGRLTTDGNVDANFNPNPDYEVRDLVTQADAKIILGGQFLNAGGALQAAVSRLETTGLADSVFLRQNRDFGKYSSLLSVNGNPAISYYDAIKGNLEYVRSTDANGSAWPNPQLIDATGDVGVGISMIIANIGGDILVKDTLGTPLTTADDDVTISSTPAVIGTPVIAYGDVTNLKLKYVVADTATGDAFTSPVSNWSTPQVIPGTGPVGLHFSLRLVDGFPAIAYQSNDSKDLKFIRAKNVAGLKNNIRDAATQVIQKIKFTNLQFTIADSWNSPIDLDTVGDVGEFPSLAMVNGQPTTPKNRPAVSYYDRTQGDLKIVVANTSDGSSWGQSVAVATVGDAGQSSNLFMTDGLQAVSFYNVTDTDLGFLIRNDASGFSRISFTGDTTWTGSITLNGSATFAPVSGQTATLSGAISGPSGFRLVGEGILNLTNAANAFGTSILRPGLTAGSGTDVNGAAIIRSGSLHIGNNTALGSALIELGDKVPVILEADRATNVQSVLNFGGYFSTKHNGVDPTAIGPGVFVKVGANIDGRYYGLYSSVADDVTNRFTGPATNGMQIQFFGFEVPGGVLRETTYYVRDKTVDGFKISLTSTGATINVTNSGTRFFYIEQSSLDSTILVKDESGHPERNGVYRFKVDGGTSLAENSMNLIRVEAFDEASEMRYGSRVNVLNGTSAGVAFFLQADVTDPNLSAANWLDEVAGASRAILASVSGLDINNAIDLNVSLAGGTSTLGALSSITTGQITFRGGLTLQSQSVSAENQDLIMTSAITSGPGLVFEGLVSEAAGGGINSDRLSLTKVGAGVMTLKANNTFSGGITINEGTLLVMNTKVATTDSGTGSGTININAGAVLGGTGSIAGAVNLFGTSGNQAILRPGDPNSSAAAVEQLIINQPITVGPNSVIEFSIGVSNMTKLAGTTINLSSESSRIAVTADPGFLPAAGTEFDLLDLNAGGLTVFGGLSNLLNLLQLPVATVWDTSQFSTSGKIIAAGDAVPVVITDHPDTQTLSQGDNVTLSVQFTGTGPNTFQWYKGAAPVLGATNQTLILTGVTQADEGDYTVRVFNPLDPAPLGIVSNPATLTVDWPLSFATDLATTRVGTSSYDVTFRVVMNGEGAPFTYQWKKGGVNVGPNSPTYTLSNLASTDAGLYSVVVTGVPLSTKPVNVVTSQVSALTVVSGPSVDAPVSPAPVAEGGDLDLIADIGGDLSTMTIQWLRNGAPILGANSPKLTLCGVTVASSGDYTIRVTGPGPNGKPITSTSSTPATVIIVDNAPKILAGQLGKIVTLTANTGSTPKVKPTYQWFKNGGLLPGDGRFTGGNTKSLKITNLNFTDTDVYTCKITGAPGTTVATAGTTYLRVFDRAPVVIASPTPPKGMVGGFYSWKIPVTSDVTSLDLDYVSKWKATPATYAVTGLPPGLIINAASGVISGYPTAANKTATSGYPIKITVTNAVKPATGVTTNITTAVIDIRPLPIGIVGTYAGSISRDVSNGNLGGRFEMTVSSLGAITGKVTAGSVAARSFKGGFNINLDNAGNIVGLIGTKIMLPGVTGAAAIDLQLDLQTTAAIVPEVAPTTWLVNATTKLCGSATGAFITGWRNKWAAKAVAGVSDVPTAYAGLPLIPAIPAKPAIPATGTTPEVPAVPAVPAIPATTGPYNFLMALPDGDPLLSNAFVPKGTGYASFTVSAAGTCTIAGRTADGMPITGAYSVGPTGQLFFFQSLYTTATKGSILGSLLIEKGVTVLDNDISGNFSWVRPPDSKSRLYPSGFGSMQSNAFDSNNTVTTPVQLVAFGGRYVAPPTTGTAPLKVLMGLDPLDLMANPNASNAELVFSESGNGVTPVAGERNPNILVKIEKGSKTTTPTFKEPALPIPVANPNPAATKVTPTASTGAFTGTFTLIDPSSTAVPLKRPVTFQGLIIRERTSGFGIVPRVTRTYGQGYFIINQLPQGAQTATLTPQLSGVVEFKGL